MPLFFKIRHLKKLKMSDCTVRAGCGLCMQKFVIVAVVVGKSNEDDVFKDKN